MSAAPPPAVLWIDPGLSTGLATLSRGSFCHVGEYPFMEACSRIDVACLTYGRHLAIGWERFTIDANTHKKTRQPEAMEVIGVARYFATRRNCQILAPAGQHTPDKADQAALKALGIWVPGKDDAQSAACHLLRWLQRANCVPPDWQRVLSEQ